MFYICFLYVLYRCLYVLYWFLYVLYRCLYVVYRFLYVLYMVLYGLYRFANMSSASCTGQYETSADIHAYHSFSLASISQDSGSTILHDGTRQNIAINEYWTHQNKSTPNQQIKPINQNKSSTNQNKSTPHETPGPKPPRIASRNKHNEYIQESQTKTHKIHSLT